MASAQTGFTHCTRAESNYRYPRCHDCSLAASMASCLKEGRDRRVRAPRPAGSQLFAALLRVVSSNLCRSPDALPHARWQCRQKGLDGVGHRRSRAKFSSAFWSTLPQRASGARSGRMHGQSPVLWAILPNCHEGSPPAVEQVIRPCMTASAEIRIRLATHLL